MNLTNVIKQCIRMNLQNQEEYAGMFPLMSRLRYGRDFKTVNLNIGRQSGKTSTIINMFRPGDLVVVATEEMKRTQYPADIKVVSLNTIKLGHDYHGCSYRGGPQNRLEFKHIFVDEPVFMTETDIDMVYNNTTADVYIFLGSPH